MFWEIELLYNYLLFFVSGVWCETAGLQQAVCQKCFNITLTITYTDFFFSSKLQQFLRTAFKYNPFLAFYITHSALIKVLLSSYGVVFVPLF